VHQFQLTHLFWIIALLRAFFITTQVLMSAGERAELATEKYIPLTPILEGLVILKKNPDFMEE
jgi:hypothetical protein